MSLPRLVLVALGLAAPVAAQSTLVFSTDTNEFTRDGADGLIGLASALPDEALTVVPDVAAPYAAHTFLGAAAQFAFLGDADGDGRWVDASTDAPGQDNDAFFVKRFLGAPAPGAFTARDLFFSKEGESDFAAGFRDGDVFSYASQGTLEVFLSEATLAAGLGTGSSIDLDAICQTATGDLFLSLSDFSVAANGPSGPFTVTDGDVLYFPAAAISYDANGDVTALTPSSVVLVASEADVNAFIAASGVRTSVGGTPSTSIDLSALEIDPNGGTWTSPQDPTLNALPNLIFAWEGFSDDGAIVSTAGGGTIATINGVPMGSTVATTGTQIGMLPDSTGIDGINGMALVDQPLAPLAVENYPVNLITSSTILYSEQEATGATPLGGVIFFGDVGGTAVGGSLTTITLGGAFSGQLFGSSFSFTVLGLGVADGAGYAKLVQTLPAVLVGSGTNLVFQAYDLSTKSFSLPAGLQFL